MDLADDTALITGSSGVRVFALCPGATETEFYARTGEEFMTRGRHTPQQVVDTSTPAVVSGTLNTVLAVSTRFLPRRVLAPVTQRMMRAT